MRTLNLITLVRSGPVGKICVGITAIAFLSAWQSQAALTQPSAVGTDTSDIAQKKKFPSPVTMSEPALVSSSPGNLSFNVPLNANVVFVFDRPMKRITDFAAAIEWNGIGLDPRKFAYTWSADGTTLTCDYEGNLPPQSFVSWCLNPEPGPILLQSEDGTPLPIGEYCGMFFTGTSAAECDPDGIPDTWGVYAVQKAIAYTQTSTADPVPVQDSPFSFSAVVVMPALGPTLTAGTVTLPSGAVKPLEPVFTNLWAFVDNSSTNENQFHTAYPAGHYVLKFTPANQSERAISMPMPSTKPPVPKIVNYDQLGNIKVDRDFTLQWTAFTGAKAGDSISIVINETAGTVVFRAPDLCVPRLLPVTATSVVIPANTFQSNRTYRAILTFRVSGYSSTNDIPEMAGTCGISVSTSFEIKTGQAVPIQPRFILSRLLPNGNPEMTLMGSPRRLYIIERAVSLGTAAVWMPAGTVTTDDAGKSVFEDTQTGQMFPLFYRAFGP